MLWRWKFRKILKLYKQWAKSIIGEDVEMEWCSDFFCLPSYPYKIWIGMLMSEKNIKELPEFLQTNFHCQFSFDKITLFTICFLHEIGHIMTDWEFDDADKEYDRENISTAEYRLLPQEWTADEWLVDYINNNGMITYQWQKKIQAAYDKVTEKDLEKFTKYKKPEKN